MHLAKTIELWRTEGEPNADYGPWLIIIMSQYWFINYNKGTICTMQDNNRGG